MNDENSDQTAMPNSMAGLSKLEYIASMAMQALISTYEVAEQRNADPGMSHYETVGKIAVIYADGLLTALELWEKSDANLTETYYCINPSCIDRSSDGTIIRVTLGKGLNGLWRCPTCLDAYGNDHRPNKQRGA